LERIHYLLVAGFDVYGNVGHQLNTRLYMDFLRMEGESQFLMFMPEEAAEKEFLSWYKGAESKVEDYIRLLQHANIKRSDLVYESTDMKAELFDKLKAYLGPRILPAQPLLPNAAMQNASELHQNLQEMASLQGRFLRFLPELSFIRLTLADGSQHVISMALNRVHKNVSSLFMEESRWLPDAFYLTLFPGILGSYPNTFYDIPEHDLPVFLQTLRALKSESDYAAMLDKWGVRRTAKDFWQFSDWLHEWYRQHQPLQAGIIDLNRFENR
jgi:hypothetical protein